MSTQQPSSASAISMGAFSTAKSLVSGLLQGVQKTAGADQSMISPNSDTSGTRITLASPTPTSTPTTGVSGATSRTSGTSATTSGMFTSTGSDMTSSLVSMQSTKTVNSSSSSSSSNFVEFPFVCNEGLYGIENIWL
ncbi:unnamed protein product [Anisakis simplex]|uniref:Secreted protein n=1 Tax=Anisakis simplex TaxID=6269 RepID=A0A0M3KHE0_ANISI|nr:unnamed protein product [Anisakis simplex]